MLDIVFLGNTLGRWIAAGAPALLLFAAITLAKIYFQKKLEKASTTAAAWDDAVLAWVRGIKIFLFALITIALALKGLKLPPKVAEISEKVGILALLAQFAVWGGTLISFFVERYVRVGTAEAGAPIDGSRATTVRAIGFVAKLGFFSILILWALDNVGIDITTLVAGLGIGGVAVALATQNILGDLFASLSIVLDRPFVLGDFIVVGDLSGTIEHIGLKSTRVRSLSGEQLVFPNSVLLKDRIRNFKRMNERRVPFCFGVSYDTSVEKVERLPAEIKTIIEAQAKTRFDRAHLKAFGESSLDFEVVYYVLDSDFNVYMDIQQAINFALMKKMAEMGVEFAFPTRTLFVRGQAGKVSGSAEERRPEVRKEMRYYSGTP